MPSKSKKKGNDFEREVCKYLNEVTGLNFTRVPNSGAFLGGKNQVRVGNLTEGQAQVFDGDIIVPDEWNEWSLECKFYKDFAWKKIFQPDGVAQLNKWIEQAKITSKPYWLLIFKINNAGAYCVLHEDTVDKFGFQLPDCVMHYRNNYVIVDMKIFLSENYERFII